MELINVKFCSEHESSCRIHTNFEGSRYCSVDMDDEYWVPNPDDEDEIMREYEQHNQGDNLDHIDFSEFENSAILNEINCSSNNVRSEISQSLSQYVDEQHSECSGKPSQL